MPNDRVAILPVNGQVPGQACVFLAPGGAFRP